VLSFPYLRVHPRLVAAGGASEPPVTEGESDDTRGRRRDPDRREREPATGAERTVESGKRGTCLGESSVSRLDLRGGDATCSDPIRVSIDEYEAVRAEPTRFMVAPGSEHVAPEVERIVQRGERFWIVEKAGIGAEMSKELDPRAG